MFHDCVCCMFYMPMCECILYVAWVCLRKIFEVCVRKYVCMLTSSKHEVHVRTCGKQCVHLGEIRKRWFVDSYIFGAHLAHT